MLATDRSAAAVNRRLAKLDPVDAPPARWELTLPTERILHLWLNAADEGVNCSHHQAFVNWARGAVPVVGSHAGEFPKVCGYWSVGTPDVQQEPVCAYIHWVRLANERGVDKVAECVLDVASVLRPTVVFAHLQTPNVLKATHIEELRRAVDDPRLVIVTWSGDVANSNAPLAPHSDWVVELGAAVDATLHVSMTHVEHYRSRGVASAYLQIGYDEEYFFQGPDWLWGRHHDLVYLYNRYVESLPPSVGLYNENELREAVALAARRIFLAKRTYVGTGIAHRKSGEFYHGSHLGLSASLSSTMRCYSSDRLTRILGSGIPALVKRFEGMGAWGLVGGTNCLTFDTPDEMVDTARHWVGKPGLLSELREIGKRGHEVARKFHSWDVKVRELALIVAAIRGEL